MDTHNPYGLTPAQRSMRARIGAHALHAKGGTTTQAATAAFLERFARQVDPDGILPPAERARRAVHARKAHMHRLAMIASRKRQLRRAARERSASVADVPTEATPVHR